MANRLKQENTPRSFSKLSVHNIRLGGDTSGVSYMGNAWIQIDRDFGGAMVPVLSWDLSPWKGENDTILLWPELRLEGDVDAELVVKLFSSQIVGDAMRSWHFSLRNLEDKITIGEPEEGFLSFSMQASGKGSIFVGTLHARKQVTKWGTILAGDRRFVDLYGGEMFSSFDFGDRRAPLVVHFSDFQRKESYEDREIFRRFGVPMLVFMDPRLFEGCYYIGTPELEEHIAANIQDAMNVLGINPSKVIFSGFGMGAYAALHYGVRFHPASILITEPVVNIYDVALDERTLRPGRFPGALDAFLYLMQVKKPESGRKLNDRIFRELDSANLQDTVVGIAYMKEDDYDPTAYDDIVEHLALQKAAVYGKGVTGRHGDDPKAIFDWYLFRLKLLLREKYNREIIV